MSKMSEIHAELTELGYDKIFEIETIINKLDLNIVTQDNIIKNLYSTYMISANAAMMIVGGAKNHSSSKAVKDRE